MGEAKDALVERAAGMGFKYQPDQFPAIFWDLFGEQGHPIRATVTEMGPLLLARLLDLNEVQEGVLNVAFKIADDEGLPLLDFKDLRAILDAIAPLDGKKRKAEGTGSALLDKVKQVTAQYGNVTKQSVGTIQRQLLVLENQGGEKFFGEPALDLKDFMRTDRDGRGYVNILAADKLMANPRLYSTFLLWLLSELFEELPEVGDPRQAQARVLLRRGASAVHRCAEGAAGEDRAGGAAGALEGRRRLFRHAEPARRARQGAGAARQSRAARACAPSPRATRRRCRPRPTPSAPIPSSIPRKVIMELGKGEALVSFLEGNGTPSMVERTMIRPPCGRIGPVTRRPSARRSSRKARSRENTTRWSIANPPSRNCRSASRKEAAPAARRRMPEQSSGGGGIGGWLGSIFGTNRKRGERLTTGQTIAREVTRTVTTRVAGQVVSELSKSIGGGKIGSTVGRAIVRGTLGGILRR